MGERLYILDDEVAGHLDASGQPTDSFWEKYPDIADAITSTKITAVLGVQDGAVKLIVSDGDEGYRLPYPDPLLGENCDYPAGFTGSVRGGLFESERELLNQSRG
jgi:hypothetical protein